MCSIYIEGFCQAGIEVKYPVHGAPNAFQGESALAENISLSGGRVPSFYELKKMSCSSDLLFHGEVRTGCFAGELVNGGEQTSSVLPSFRVVQPVKTGTARAGNC